MSSEDSDKLRFPLTAAESIQWQEKGFFVRAGVYSESEMTAMGRRAAECALGKVPYPAPEISVNAKMAAGELEKREGLAAMHGVYHPHLYNRYFCDAHRDPRITDPLVGLIGPDILAIDAMIIFKPPQVGMGFPWHQDLYYFRQRYDTGETVGTWTAIDQARIDNGCLWVIPGSHRGEIVAHDLPPGPQQREYRLARGADDSLAVPCEMEPGSVLFFHGHLLHRSTQNVSLEFRRSYVRQYLSARATWANDEVSNSEWRKPVMWIRGETFEGCVQAEARDVLPVPAA